MHKQRVVVLYAQKRPERLHENFRHLVAGGVALPVMRAPRVRAEWNAYAKSGKKPNDIPAVPSQTYAGIGWAGIGDWLGSGVVAYHLREYRSFEEARAFVHSLKLKSGAEWLQYYRSGKKPADIPNAPHHVYSSSGWAGMPGWLGSGTIANSLRKFRSSKKGRAFARSLKLKSGTEWRAYSKSGRKPDDIPADPRQTYAEVGWVGMGDWLGYVR